MEEIKSCDTCANSRVHNNQKIWCKKIEICGDHFIEWRPIGSKSELETIVEDAEEMFKKYNPIKPKTKEQMTDKRVIFESEEEAREILEGVIIEGTATRYTGLLPSQFEETIKGFYINGYIRRDPVEEAEEMYQQWIKNEYDGINLIHKQRNVIQELKSEIERLKK